MQERTFGTLRARVAGGTDREGAGDGPAVILLHGFGAPGTDLVPLWRQLDVPHAVRFVFPEAPLDMGRELGPGARAWWRLDVEALMARARGDGPPRDEKKVPEGLPEARAQLVALLDAVQSDLHVPAGQLVLGGFSQGAMLSLDVALHDPRPLAGLVLMSGTLIAADDWTPRLATRKGVPVLQSHGRTDPLLPFSTAERLRDLLIAAGLPVRWDAFNGGHTITDGVVDALGAFIREHTE